MGAAVNLSTEARRLRSRDAAPVVGTYLCGHGGRCGPDAYGWGSIPDDHCWHESTRRRLAWQYGEARAAAIMAGDDPASQRDEEAWDCLGGRS